MSMLIWVNQYFKAPEHEYIFSKYSWNLIKNIILKIFRRLGWNYFKNFCEFVYLCMFVFKNKRNSSIAIDFVKTHLKISKF